MRVAVTRSGGFAGITRRARLDSDDHPVVARLIEEIDIGGAAPAGRGPAPDTADRPPETAPGGRPAGERRPARGADRFVYEIEIGDRTVRVGEAELRGPLRTLVEHVLAHGR